MNEALVPTERPGSPATAAEIRAQVNLIQEVMKAVMKDGTHYGTIPGCQKPSLYKPGSEKILSTFRIAIEPVVEDLSTADEARYRVITRATAQASGVYLGSGIGECSSSEEKYRWKAAVCDEEWVETPEDRRRKVWKKGEKKPYTVLQIRTHPADVANTVLKMAKKRSQIDVTLTVTAASDVFVQDIEDLPDDLRHTAVDEANGKPPIQPPQQKADTPKPEPKPDAPPAPKVREGEPIISEAQARRFYAIAKGQGWTDQEQRDWLRSQYGIDDSRQIPRRLYEEICSRMEGGDAA